MYVNGQKSLLLIVKSDVDKIDILLSDRNHNQNLLVLTAAEYIGLSAAAEKQLLII